MRRFLFVILLAASLCPTAAAQILKPVKDKDSKLFGYQDETKNWVIAPRFNNAKKFHGSLAEVMVKQDGNKIWGVINTEGEDVVPLECEDVSVNDRQGIILANRYFTLNDPGRYTNTDLYAWGVYDLEGNEIWAPQFDSKPAFNSDGNAIVKDKATRKVGVISIDGHFVIDMVNFGISSSLQGYTVLDSNLNVYTTGNASAPAKGGRTLFLGVVPCTIPYNTDGDDMKAAAYGHRRIGERLTCNTVFCLDTEPSGRTNVTLGNIRTIDGQNIDWGRYNDRFVRLELAYAPEGSQFAVPDSKTGVLYTVAANIYEPGGEFIESLSPEGLLYADLAQGLAYKTSSGQYWFIAGDPNWPGNVRRTTLNVNRMIDCNCVEDMVGLSTSEKNDLCNFWRSGRRHQEVELADIGALLSYDLPAELENRDAVRYQDRLISSYGMFFRRYRKGQIYQISSFRSGKEEGTVKVSDEQPRANMRLEYPTGFTYELRDPIFWGARGDRYVRIVPVPKRYRVTPVATNGLIDDRPDSKYVITFEFRLYEEDGTFVQTLGTSRSIWFGDEEIVGFKDIEWVFTNREPKNGSIRFLSRHEPLTGRIQDLDWMQF